jgi:hypothetical protein
MKRQIVKPLVLLIGLAIGGAAMAADAPTAGGVYATDADNGSVELSNIATTDNQEPVVAAPDPAAAAPADAQAAGAEPPKDPREQYRENLIKSEQATAGATSNASRRYKMMDKATYQATVLGTNPQAPQDQPKAQ